MQIKIHYLVFTVTALVIVIFSFMIASIFERGEIVFTNIQQYSGPVVTEYNPFTGSNDPQARLILYSNFTCPNCASFSQSVVQAIQGRDVVLIWKDLPNDSLNPNSTLASLGAHCASDQGRFWAYHDILMEQRGSISRDVLLAAAEQLNLRMNRFMRCLDDRDMEPIVTQAIDEASQLDITTAPTLFIGNTPFATGVINTQALENELDLLLSL